MKIPALPVDEAERLADLLATGVLDTSPEQAFDDIAQLLAYICEVPIALVSLVDAERQWFKARVGLDATETPRDLAFCAHAILDDELFVVPDARSDERFHDNPLVVGEPRVRFYAGAPLLSRHGRALGTLCAIDHEPRTLRPEQRIALEALGRQTATQLELRRQTVELRQARGQVQELLENATDLVQVVSPDGRLLLVNRAWRRSLGHDQASAEQLTLFDLLPPEERPAAREQLARVVAGEPSSNVLGTLVARDGRRILVEGSSSCRSEGGQPTAVLQVFRDVSERLELERMKDEFVATVSHELRTPLTSLQGSLRMLHQGHVGELPEQATELLQVADRSTDRLVRLVNDLLDLEKSEAGGLQLELADLDAGDLARLAFDGLQGAAAEAGVSLEVEVPVPLRLSGDEDRLVQVLTNLGSNALKYSPRGGCVLIRVDQGDRERVRFTVCDEGPGIAEEQVPLLFERFRQLERADGGRVKGTGLGLAIARAICLEHGGAIGVDSEVGSGSRFWFESPPPEAPGHGVSATPAVQNSHRLASLQLGCSLGGRTGDEQPERAGFALVRGLQFTLAGSPLTPESCGDGRTTMSQRTILFVDDDPDMGTLVSACLEQDGHRVVCVASVSEALRVAFSSFPDLVITDVMMPSDSGYVLCEKLRADPSTAAIPVVFLTCIEGEQAAMQAGATAFHSKPLNQKELRSTVAALLQADGSRPLFDSGLEAARSGRFDEARDKFERVAATDAGSELATWARYQLARIAEHLEQPAEAERRYSELLYDVPEFWRAHNRLAELARRDGALSKALKHLKRSLALNASQPDVEQAIELIAESSRASNEPDRLPESDSVAAEAESAFALPGGAASEAASELGGDGPDIIVADDDQDMAVLTAAILAGAGYRVRVATDGAEMLEMAGERRPDLVVVDGLMPRVNGLEASRRLKEEVHPSDPPRVLLVTGIYTKRRQRSEAESLFLVDEVIAKPFQPEQLLATVERHLEAASSKTPLATSAG